MKFIRNVIVVALALSLSACATKWVKAGSTEQDLLTDQAYCEQDADSAFAMRGRLEALANALDKRGYFERCMIAHGWRDKDGQIASVQPSTRNDPPLSLPGYSR